MDSGNDHILLIVLSVLMNLASLILALVTVLILLIILVRGVEVGAQFALILIMMIIYWI